MNEYQIAALCGGAIAALWVLAYILCWVGQWAWAWVDDSEVGKVSLLISWIAGVTGYEYVIKSYSSSFVWKKKGKRDSSADWGFVPFFNIALITSSVPMVVVLCFNLYQVAISILIAAMLAWVARFSRRHKKLFDKHVVDKDAHK